VWRSLGTCVRRLSSGGRWAFVRIFEVSDPVTTLCPCYAPHTNSICSPALIVCKHLA
jgi:hypothetical protein